MGKKSNKKLIQEVLTRAVAEVIIKEELENKLRSGRKLRVKLGIDPTAPDIHLGHAVSLMKLRQFQALGHQIVLIIGDFTATIGDPTARIETRRPLSAQEIKNNLKNYLKQAGKIIDIDKTEVRYNSEWFEKLKPGDLYDLTSKVTVQQILEREDFQKRIQEGRDITVSEMFYPLFQGYDSVRVKADVEIGGSDQKVNLLMGRRVQRVYGMVEQDILTTWLLEGTDGARKMSKSYGNYIGVSEKPKSMFGKVMSIPDSLIIKYFRALTTIEDGQISEMGKTLKNQRTNPRDIKLKLALEIVKFYWGEKLARKAQEEFERVFTKKLLPQRLKTCRMKLGHYFLADLLVRLRLASSKSEARRLIEGGGVRINGQVQKSKNGEIEVRSNMVFQVGKRRFIKIK